ncbi:MAG: hypothetical protein WCZ19_02250 [Acholeplasma sp.]
MFKKLTGLIITVLLLFLLAACNPSEEDEMNIPFEINDKTTNYFDADGREVLLQMVNSLDELTQLLVENEFSILPMYEESFFEEYTLILYFFVAEVYNELDITIKAEDGSLSLYKTFDLPDGLGLTAERFWTFMIEIKNIDIVNFTQIKIK